MNETKNRTPADTRQPYDRSQFIPGVKAIPFTWDEIERAHKRKNRRLEALKRVRLILGITFTLLLLLVPSLLS